MRTENKKILMIQRIMAFVLCFAIGLAVVSSPVAMAKSGQLTLTYKGKTIVLNKASAADTENAWKKWTNFKKIKKAFGKTQTYENRAGKTIYGYKEKGFIFSFYAVDETSPLEGSVTVKILSKKAALNGIEIGMSFKDVQKKLEKQYGKSFVTAAKKKGKIELEYAGYYPVQYTFKNGKVSKMYFMCS